MLKAKQVFDDYFKTWNIYLPASHLYQRRRGIIWKRGWTIEYKFGIEDGVEYVEYFSTNKWTNDCLFKIYEDGTKELVNFAHDFYPVDEDAQQEYREHNQKFDEEVKEKFSTDFEQWIKLPDWMVKLIKGSKVGDK